ncbi:hypothetical protein VQ056_17725 [Paenibacillus sp. JTLBN-2024]
MLLKQKQRIFYGLVILTGILVVLILRLAYVQLVFRASSLPHSKYTLQEMSVLQRERGVVLDSGRGNVYDRNGKPLTGKPFRRQCCSRWTVSLENKDGRLNPVARALGVDSERLATLWGRLSVPLLWKGDSGSAPLALTEQQAKRISALEFSGLEVLPYTERYENRPNGMQWLGYLTDVPGQCRCPIPVMLSGKGLRDSKKRWSRYCAASDRRPSIIRSMA